MATGSSLDLAPRYRLPLFLFAFIALLAGVFGGLLRIGWPLPAVSGNTALLHGPLLIPGFFGTLIALERAAALSRRWAYAGPLLTGLGVIGVLLGSTQTGAALLGLGSLVFAAASLAAYRRQPALFTASLLGAALMLVVGDGLWLFQGHIYHALLWWLGFLVLTIAGERLELSRFLQRPPYAEALFGVLLLALVGGPLLGSWQLDAGARLFGFGLVALALWLALYDLARRTVRLTALPRYIAYCLLSGYAWLALAGCVMLGDGLTPGRLSYDAALHALLLGFVFSMVLGHAPVILPAVLRISLPYRPILYLPLLALHVSLAVRLLGDALAQPGLRSVGGLLNALALGLFVIAILASLLSKKPQNQPNSASGGGSARRITISAKTSVSKRQ